MALSRFASTPPVSSDVGEGGFRLTQPATTYYAAEDSQGIARSRFTPIAQLFNDLHAQRDATAYQEATCLHGVDLDGNIQDVRDGDLHNVGMRLSRAAFNDLCAFCGIPVRFIQQFALYDPSLAQRVLRSAIDQFIQNDRGKTKRLVIDTRYNRVEGIVSAGYKVFDNLDAFRTMLTAHDEFKPTQAWLCGPSIRFTGETRRELVGSDPQVGDIIQLGQSVQNALNGDCAIHMRAYAQILRCTNGMMASRDLYAVRIPHVGEDLKTRVGSHALKVGKFAEKLIPQISAAQGYILSPKQLDNVREYIATNGGNKQIEEQAVQLAVVDSEERGKGTAITLWSMVQGVTATAHRAPSLQRRMALEALGVDLLEHFSESWKLN